MIDPHRSLPDKSRRFIVLESVCNLAGRGDNSANWPIRVKRPGERKSLSRSATRALDVLEFFGLARRPLRAVEIARRLELHPSTANQLLKTMLESAHLTFDSLTKTYLPSPRLARFGGWIVETYGADEWLRGLVATLQAQTGQLVTLTTPNDVYMQVIDLAGVDMRLMDSGNPERGLRVSMFGTAIGAAHLSTLPDAEIVRLADRARLTPEDKDKLLRRMVSVRRDGFADGPSPDTAIWSIATPLPCDDRSPPLVLGLAGPSDRIRPDLSALGTAMRTAVARSARD